jgi:hypothetical protein
LLWLCAGINNWSKWIWRSSNPRSSEDDLVVFRIGSILVLFFLFSFIFQFLQFL